MVVVIFMRNERLFRCCDTLIRLEETRFRPLAQLRLPVYSATLDEPMMVVIMHEVDRRDRSKMFSDEQSDKHMGITIPLSRVVMEAL